MLGQAMDLVDMASVGNGIPYIWSVPLLPGRPVAMAIGGRPTLRSAIFLHRNATGLYCSAAVLDRKLAELYSSAAVHYRSAAVLHRNRTELYSSAAVHYRTAAEFYRKVADLYRSAAVLYRSTAEL
jgi:hypothetical protein